MKINSTNVSFVLSIAAILSNTVNASEYTLESSVISAGGFMQNIKEAPASISIVSKDNLLSRPVRDIGDAVDFVPGVEISKSKTGSSQIKIRGFDSAYTAILIDGRRQNSSTAIIDNGFDPNASFLPPMSMIERIEVIRGPASVLYGSDAIGGVVNIITRKNPKELTGTLGLEGLLQEKSGYGNAFGYNGYIAIPLVEDKLSLSLRGKGYDKGGSSIKKPDNSYASHSNGDYDLYNYGARINYSFNDQHNIYIDAERNHESGSVNSTSANSIMAQREWLRENVVLNYEGQTQLGTLNTSLGYNNTELVGVASSGPNGAGGLMSSDYDTQFSKNYTFALQAIMPFETEYLGAFNLSTGYELWHERLRKDSVSSIRGREIIQNHNSFFAETEYFVTDATTVTLGGRVNHGSIFGSRFTPRVYVNYVLNDSVSFKGGIATGYKVPNLIQTVKGLSSGDINDAGAQLTWGNPDLKPESSVSYELAAMFDLHNIGQATLTGFYTTFKDKITKKEIKIGTSPYLGADKCPLNARSCTLYENVDKSVSYGAELMLSSAPFYGFNIEGAYTYTTSKSKSGSSYGEPLSEIPRHNVMLKLNYNYEKFNAYIKSVSKLRTPVVNTKTNNSGRVYYKDYTVIDLSMNYKFNDKHKIAFAINNLLNRDFNTYDVYTSRGTTAYGAQYSDYIEGRNYYLSYTMEF